MRDYSTISPSAKSLLLTKGLTDIPFIANAARLVWGDHALNEISGHTHDALFLRRLMHFEVRYKSLDSLLQELGGKNFLEISSGFSFRGLDRCMQNADTVYVDTDLPEVIATKIKLTEQLIDQQNIRLQGQLHTLAMNALDEDSFTKNIELLPAGPVNILNEGLLVYLNTAEKMRLCEIIRAILKKRGGYWVTADVYIKKNMGLKTNDMFSKFLQSHNVEENKFESFEQAEQFFNECGLKIHQKAGSVWRQLSSLKYIPQHALDEFNALAGKYGRIRETWALVPA